MGARNLHAQERSAASPSPPDTEATYWGPPYSPNAPMVTLDRGSVWSASPQPPSEDEMATLDRESAWSSSPQLPSEDDRERQQDLVQALQRELLRETLAWVSGFFHLNLLSFFFL